MRWAVYTLMSLVCMSISLTSDAQYLGPSNSFKTELKQVLEKPIDDEPVRLQGYLTKKLSTDKYIFSDGRYEIRVEIDQHVFPVDPFTERDLIEIEGEVDKDFFEPLEIDVSRLAVVRR